ncbi:MAG: FHA domain-containing protein [Gemmataceae bacterium]
MLGDGWLIFKQAHDLLEHGRIDEATELLNDPQLKNHRRANEMLRQVVRSHVLFGERLLRNDDTFGAWKHLLKAEAVGLPDKTLDDFRRTLVRLGLAEIRALLEAGEPDRALAAIQFLREKAVHQPELDPLEQGVRDWVLAKEQAEYGEFAQALQTLARVRKLLPTSGRAIRELTEALQHRQTKFAPAILELFAAAEDQHWRMVLELSEALLVEAPQHPEVRKLRSRAWKALEPATIAYAGPEHQAIGRTMPPPRPTRPQQYALWVDGVGGYLLCLENRVTLGQGGVDANVSIPIYADISRLHAAIERDEEGYALEAFRDVTINNNPVERDSLSSGDRIQLGTSCQMLFRQNVPISSSAVLTLTSGHRFAHAVDGVILMTETLLLGGAEKSHISLPNANRPIILYRVAQGKGIFGIGMRHSGNFQLNGCLMKDRAVLDPGSRVVGENFSLTLELL